MPDIFTFDEALVQVGQLLDRLQSRRATFDDPTKAAVRAVWRAVDQTKLHLAAIREARTDRGTPKQELAELWSDASLAIVDVDPEFARRLRKKAEYWSDPVSWQDDPALDISIESVADTARSLLPLAIRKPPAVPPHARSADVFVSHAREDKETVADPLADALRRYGYAVWLDRCVLGLGDNLRRNIDAALGTCRYGAVILSPSFFRKEWPQRELDGLVAMETQDHRKRVLPVWHQVTATDVARYSPTLADRLGISTDLGIDVVVSAVVDVLKRDIPRSGALGDGST
jgi:TIR domain